MQILKPSVFGDDSVCYKGYPSAIIILGCVNARGVFTNIKLCQCWSCRISRRRFCLNSELCARMNNVLWASAQPQMINGQAIHVFLFGDAAFSLSDKLMKCFEGQNLLL